MGETSFFIYVTNMASFAVKTKTRIYEIKIKRWIQTVY